MVFSVLFFYGSVTSIGHPEWNGNLPENENPPSGSDEGPSGEKRTIAFHDDQYPVVVALPLITALMVFIAMRPMSATMTPTTAYIMTFFASPTFDSSPPAVI